MDVRHALCPTIERANQSPGVIRGRVIELALEWTQLSPRELVGFTDRDIAILGL